LLPLPLSSPAAAAIVKIISFLSFEGGFNTHSSEGTTGQELFSPVLRFPGESVTKLYKKVTDERLLIEVEGMLKLYGWLFAVRQ
jgi:hypothetical protein